MHALAVTHNQLRAITTLTTAASRDDITTTITGIRLETADGRLVAVATDRYRVAELSFPINETADALHTPDEADNIWPGVTIPAALLARVVKQLPRRPVVPNPTVAILHDEDHNRIIIRDQLAGFETMDGTVTGNYPPVARLFPNVDTIKPFAGVIRLNAAHLTTLEKLALPSDIGGRSVEKCYDMHTQTSENPNKPAPVLFTRTDETKYDKGAGAHLRYLIQPTLILR